MLESHEEMTDERGLAWRREHIGASTHAHSRLSALPFLGRALPQPHSTCSAQRPASGCSRALQRRVYVGHPSFLLPSQPSRERWSPPQAPAEPWLLVVREGQMEEVDGWQGPRWSPAPDLGRSGKLILRENQGRPFPGGPAARELSIPNAEGPRFHP